MFDDRLSAQDVRLLTLLVNAKLSITNRLTSLSCNMLIASSL